MTHNTMTHNTMKIFTAAILASVLGVASITAAEGQPRTGLEQISKADIDTTAQPTTAFAPDASQGSMITQEPLYVTPFLERDRIHESVQRLIQLRREQALANPDEFWESYVILGREQTLETRVTLRSDGRPLPELLTELAKIAGTRFETSPRAELQKVELEVSEASFSDVLKAICQQSQTVPIYDRFADSYVLAEIRMPEPIRNVEEFAIPVRHSDPAALLAFARKLDFNPGQDTVALDPQGTGYLYTGGVDGVRQLRTFVREFDRRPPPEGVQYTHAVIELQHKSPRGIIPQLWRTFHGNFAARENKLGIVVVPDELEAVRQRVAEFDQPEEEG